MRPLSIPAPIIGFALTLAPAFGVEHVVTMDGNSFDPADLTITVGDVVIWQNDGGLHNVVADDGSFSSGPASTDLWTFSRLFHRGGSVPYHCEEHAGHTGTITVEGVFADAFEEGSFDLAWDAATGLRQTCTCYFSGDCVSGEFCNYGPGSFATEDICTWVDNKPNGVPGTNCDQPHFGPWGGPICDGVCQPSSVGSALGWEELALIDVGIELWGDAILEPALAGGGPVDPELSAAALALPFVGSEAGMELGRQVASLLNDVGLPELYDHFCHWEQHPTEPDPTLFFDLSDDACRAERAVRSLGALRLELQEKGSGRALADSIGSVCEGKLDALPGRCAQAERPLECVYERISGLAEFLSTPSGASALFPLDS